MATPSQTNNTLGGRVAVVGTGSRAAMFVRGIVARPASQVVAFCEPNAVRATYYNNLLAELGAPKVPVYQPDQFKEMLSEENVDTVVITCIDALHDLYIVPALEAGVRVLTEKPMTTDADKCRRILETVQRTGRHLTVTFNYRYNPVHELVKRTLAQGKIGEIISVHFEWLLDTVHGADYFRRWHRQKKNSGGLMVHKAGHHFDLVNWWIDAQPVSVAGFGKLSFYGKEAGTKHKWAKDYVRAHGNENAKQDPFAIQLEADPSLKKIYLEAESEDGYHRDQNTAYSPWEGYRVMFNGSHGRLELEVVESQYRLLSDMQGMDGLIHGNQALPHAGEAKVTLHNLWQKPEQIPIKYEHGAHGGGDIRMLSALFGPLPGEAAESGDASKQGANERDGALALAVGVMANESFKTGKFVEFESLNFPL